MKSWSEFRCEAPDIAESGKQMILHGGKHVGLAFLATLRRNGSPRLHPVSPVFFQEHLFVFIPTSSPKCTDLLRDGRFAMQAFPPPQNEAGKEFYLTGEVICIRDLATRHAIISETGIHVGEQEVLFELLLDRAMFTMLVDRDTPYEHAEHSIWKASAQHQHQHQHQHQDQDRIFTPPDTKDKGNL